MSSSNPANTIPIPAIRKGGKTWRKIDNPVSFVSPDNSVSLESWLDTSSVGVGISLEVESESAIPMQTSDGFLVLVDPCGRLSAVVVVVQMEDTLEAGVIVNNGFLLFAAIIDGFQWSATNPEL